MIGLSPSAVNNQRNRCRREGFTAESLQTDLESEAQPELNLALWKGRRERKWRARRNRREVGHDAMDIERSVPASTEGRGKSEHWAHLVVHAGVVRVVGQVKSFRR